MNKKLAIILAGLAIIPMLGTQSLAHHAPFTHFHPSKRVVKRAKRVIRYAPKRRVVVHRHRARTVVIHERPAPVIIRTSRPPRQVVTRRPAPPIEAPVASQLLGVGLRASTSRLGGVKLGLDNAENPVMAGAGVVIKAQLDRNLGFEITLDALTGAGDDFQQTTVPVMASLTYSLMPESRIQPFALVGAGVNFTTLEYLDGKFRYNMAEFSAQVGAGLEVFLSPTLSVQGDVRAQTVIRNLDTQAEIRDDCLSTLGDETGFCGGINDASVTDKINVGMTAHVGVNLYF